MSQSRNVRKSTGSLDVNDKLHFGESTADGFDVTFDGTNTLNVDAVNANDAVRVGENVLTDLQVDGAGSDLLWDASANSLTNGGHLGLFAPNGAIETVTSSSTPADVSITTSLTAVTSSGSGTDVVGIPDGTAVGHVKCISLVVDGGATLRITPDNYADGTSLDLANAGDFAIFKWNGSAWRTLIYNRGTVNA